MTLAEAIQKVNEEYVKLYGKSAVITFYLGSDISFTYEEDPETEVGTYIFVDADGTEYQYTEEEVVAYMEDHPDDDRAITYGAPLPAVVKIWYQADMDVWYAKYNNGRSIELSGLV